MLNLSCTNAIFSPILHLFSPAKVTIFFPNNALIPQKFA